MSNNCCHIDESKTSGTGVRENFDMEDRLNPLDEVVKVPITEINPYVTCGTCAGYLVHCITITECLHSFCKSCIVKHLKNSNECPVCEAEIHPTTPLANIRYDATKQDIVNKLLPHVLTEERLRELDFYISRNMTPPKAPGFAVGELSQANKNSNPSTLVTPPPLQKEDCLVSVALEYGGSADPDCNIEPLKKKFIRVTSRATVLHIQKFLKRRLALPHEVKVPIYCQSAEMSSKLTLQNVLDLYYQGQASILVLFYGIA